MLISRLLDPACFPHPVERVTLHETHISWVLLTGAFAYKIKKPVDLGWVNFSTPERRRFFCEEEIRLNRRLAPDLYLGIVPICGSPDSPRVGGDGPAIDHAVKMRQFPDEDRLDRVLSRGELRTGHIDGVARRIAVFHGDIGTAGEESDFGRPETVLERVEDNFKHILEVPSIEPDHVTRIENLRAWCRTTHGRLVDEIRARREQGFVKECHGDMHLANMALFEGDVVIFDGIDFNPKFRWIDVVSEVAFLTMDLADRRRRDLARRFINFYLEHTGDYEGLNVFRYYEVYRALVRAKVACIRMAQNGVTEEDRSGYLNELASYSKLAESFTRPPPPALWIMHGVAGSGKTFASQRILEATGAIRLRSDVERKRLFGIDIHARTEGSQKKRVYGPDASRKTFSRLAGLAETIVRAGHRVIVDATFLGPGHRQTFRELAARLGVPFAILHMETSRAVLRDRVWRRRAEGEDASEADLAVLETQLSSHQELDDGEIEHTFTVDGDSASNLDEVIQQLRQSGPGS